MQAKKLLTSRQIFRYAVPARTVTKKALTVNTVNHLGHGLRTFTVNTINHPLPRQPETVVVEKVQTAAAICSLGHGLRTFTAVL